MKLNWRILLLFFVAAAAHGGFETKSQGTTNAEKEAIYFLNDSKHFLQKRGAGTSKSDISLLLNLPYKYLFGTNSASKDKLQQDLISLRNFPAQNSNSVMNKKKRIKDGEEVKNLSQQNFIEKKSAGNLQSPNARRNISDDNEGIRYTEKKFTMNFTNEKKLNINDIHLSNNLHSLNALMVQKEKAPSEVSKLYRRKEELHTTRSNPMSTENTIIYLKEKGVQKKMVPARRELSLELQRKQSMKERSPKNTQLNSDLHFGLDQQQGSKINSTNNVFTRARVYDLRKPNRIQLNSTQNKSFLRPPRVKEARHNNEKESIGFKYRNSVSPHKTTVQNFSTGSNKPNRLWKMTEPFENKAQESKKKHTESNINETLSEEFLNISQQNKVSENVNIMFLKDKGPLGKTMRDEFKGEYTDSNEASNYGKYDRVQFHERTSFNIAEKNNTNLTKKEILISSVLSSKTKHNTDIYNPISLPPSIYKRKADLLGDSNKTNHISFLSVTQSNNKQFWDTEYFKDLRFVPNSTVKFSSNTDTDKTRSTVQSLSSEFPQFKTDTPRIKIDLEKHLPHQKIDEKITTMLPIGFSKITFIQTSTSDSLKSRKTSEEGNSYTNTSSKRQWSRKTDPGKWTEKIADKLSPHWPFKETGDNTQDNKITEMPWEGYNQTKSYSPVNFIKKHTGTLLTELKTEVFPSTITSFRDSDSSYDTTAPVTPSQKAQFHLEKDDSKFSNVRSSKTKKMTHRPQWQKSVSFITPKKLGSSISKIQHRSMNKTYVGHRFTEVHQTVKIAGVLATNGPMDSSYVKERISFITIPPVSHWHLWSSFTGRRRVDPFFEFSNTNFTSDITQVYTAYWGGSTRNTSSIAGIWILRLGAGIAFLSLVSTVIAQTLRFCQPLLSQKAVLITNLSTSLGAAHVVFVFGIQATDGVWMCGVVSLFLHFLYLLTGNWLLALSIRLLRSLLQKKPFPTAAYCIPVWLASLAVVVVSYSVNPSGYETKRFCWLSVERGMLFAFIGPVCTLLMVNAGVCIASQKVLLDAGGKTDPCDKNDLRAGVILLPLHGVAWFLTVVALEDDLSLALDATAALTTASVGALTLQFFVPTWQFFFSEVVHPTTGSFPTAERQISIAECTDTANLPLLHNRISTYSWSEPTTSTPSVVEEYQMEPIFSDDERKNAY